MRFVILFALLVSIAQARASERPLHYTLLTTVETNSSVIDVEGVTSVTLRVSFSEFVSGTTAKIVARGKFPPPYDGEGFQDLDAATTNNTRTFQNPGIDTYVVQVPPGMKKMRFDASTDTGNVSATIEVVAP